MSKEFEACFDAYCRVEDKIINCAAYDIFKAGWIAANARSGNYIADDEVYPAEVRFENGRIVRAVIANGKPFLEVEQDTAPTPANVVQLRPEPANKSIRCHTCGAEIVTSA